MDELELKQRIRRIGFQDFTIVKDTSRFENQITNYLIDIVPFRLKICDEHFYDETLNNEIPRTSFCDMEDFYYKKDNFKNLQKRWYAILIKFAYYYKLKSIYVYALGSDQDPDIQTLCNDLGFFLQFQPINIMNDIETFIYFVDCNINGVYIIFEFQNNLVFHMFFDELFLTIHSLNETLISPEIINTLELLVNSEHLFLRKI